MPYAFFNELCPDLAKNETRTITIFEDSDIPLRPGEYALLEMFCNERKCDCRRVFFYVVSPGSMKPLAVVAYGWESRKFYAKWLRSDDPEMVSDLQGPILNPGSPLSDLSPAILDMIENIVLKDDAYIERVKTHYNIYRAKIERVSTVRRRRGKIKLKR